MNIPEPLRDNPFRLRRRRSLNSILFGEGHAAPLRALDGSQGYGQIPTPAAQGFSSKTYMSDRTDEYVPHVGSMQTPNDDYMPYDGSELHNIPKSDLQRFFDEFRMAASELTRAVDFEPKVRYEDGLTFERTYYETRQP